MQIQQVLVQTFQYVETQLRTVPQSSRSRLPSKPIATCAGNKVGTGRAASRASPVSVLMRLGVMLATVRQNGRASPRCVGLIDATSVHPAAHCFFHCIRQPPSYIHLPCIAVSGRLCHLISWMHGQVRLTRFKTDSSLCGNVV